MKELINNKECHYEGKLYECKNFEFPYLEIKKYENDNEYSLNFLNENHNTEKYEVYQDNIPESILRLYNLNNKESIRGFLTEITCIQTITN
ncbi:MAG: hypothetical protein IJJ47_00955 [Methanosphaera sp.]|nr:hypothetical protein [Methanosphaera sp.]